MIEVRVRDENVRHVLRRHAALRQYHGWRLPVLDTVARRQHFTVGGVVVADVDHRRLPLSLDHDVAVGHLAVPLIVSAVDEQAGRLFEHVRVFHHPD